MKEPIENKNTSPSTEHLLSLLQIRTDALIQYSQRIWTLFNWFLTLHVAMVGYYFGIIQAKNLTLAIPLMGVVLSFLWLLIGIEDYQTFLKHKKIKKAIEGKVAERMSLTKVFNEIKKKNKSEKGKNESEEQNKSEEEKNKFNQTHMLMIFPILTCVFWIYVAITVG